MPSAFALALTSFVPRKRQFRRAASRRTGTALGNALLYVRQNYVFLGCPLWAEGTRLPRKRPSTRKAGRQSKRVQRFDVDLYFEPGFEAKVAERLQSNVRMRKILGLFESDKERQILIFLLCHTVFCRTQQIKSDDATALVAGTTTENVENVENARERVESFCQWLWPHLHHNSDLLCFDEARTVIPTLLNIADVIAAAVPAGRGIAQDWNRNYVAALDSLRQFIEDKTGKRRYADMAALLEESARALGKSQTYSAHTILVRLKSHRSK